MVVNELDRLVPVKDLHTEGGTILQVVLVVELRFERLIAFLPEAGMRDDDKGASLATQPVLLGEISQARFIAGECHPHSYG